MEPELVPLGDHGRRYEGSRRVRLGEVTASGRMRVDALARALQDVATDDAADAGLADGWVLRRLAMRIDRFPRFREPVTLVTWCSGVTASAAERRTTVSLAEGPAVESVGLWVFVGRDGRPARIDRDSFAVYGVTAGDRRISTRLRHADPPDGTSRPWPLRATDIDVLGHVNNAVSLAALEDVVREVALDDSALPWWVEVEYRAAIDPGDDPLLVWARVPDGTVVGGLLCEGAPRTTFRVHCVSRG